jgi:hypothetical protein
VEIETVYMYMQLALLFVGIAIALFGRAIWRRVLAGIGSMIGWMIGFGAGVWFFGYDSAWDLVYAFIIGLVCAIILGAIFATLVELALCLLIGLLAGGFIYFFHGNLAIAAVVFLVVTVVAFMLREYAISAVTAAIGAILAGVSIYYLTDKSFALASMASVLLFVLGTIIQFYALADNDNYKDD